MPAASEECRAAGRSIGSDTAMVDMPPTGTRRVQKGLGSGRVVSRCRGSGVRNIVGGNEMIATNWDTQILAVCGATFSKIKLAEERFSHVDRAEHVDPS